MKGARLAAVIVFVTAMTLVMGASAMGAEKISNPFQYSGYTEPEYTGQARTARFVTMTDGTKLAIVW